MKSDNPTMSAPAEVLYVYRCASCGHARQLCRRDYGTAMTTTQWGRKETIVRPFHSPIYTYGAACIAFIHTCFFLYLWASLAMTPLQRFYLPIYVRTGVAGMLRKADSYRLLTVADVHLHVRPSGSLRKNKRSTWPRATAERKC
jgi:hypothetical protein